MPQKIKDVTEKWLVGRYSIQVFIPLVDIFSVLAGCELSYWWRFSSFNMPDRFVLFAAMMSLFVIVLNGFFGIYLRWNVKSISKLVSKLFVVWFFSAMFITFFMYFTHSAEFYSRLWVGCSLLMSFVLSCGFRLGVQIFLKYIRAKGFANRLVFLVGSKEDIASVAVSLREHSEDGFSLVGLQYFKIKPTMDDLNLLSEKVIKSGAHEVWLCMSINCSDEVRDIMYALRNLTVDVRFIPDFGTIDMELLNSNASEIVGLYSVDLSVSPITGIAWLIKRMEDLILGSLIFLLIFPLCILIALLIKITSKGPILFKQCRTGVNGETFEVYKFRTMRMHNEPADMITQAIKDDPRITPVGFYLRRISLDELPQFINVIQGHMSIVGPRPHALAHNIYYKDLVESYMKRHKVKPGITGWAQVNGLRGETDTLDKMKKRVKYDLWYIDNWSLWLDLKIIAMTILKGFVNKNAY